MKKIHLILLIVAGVMALFSIYSLAAINQVYNINFKWYSQYSNQFTNDVRMEFKDKWQIPGITQKIRCGVIQDSTQLGSLQKLYGTGRLELPKVDFEQSILLYCSLGRVFSPDYRVKVVDIAQRENAVEVRLSINSPSEEIKPSSINVHEYLPIEVVKVDKDAFPIKGGVFFIFKDQEGKKLYEQYCILG